MKVKIILGTRNEDGKSERKKTTKSGGGWDENF